jgi:hypothetical protein
MKFVTCEASPGFLASRDNLPGDVVVYGVDVPYTHVQPLSKAQSKLGRYVPPSWQFDILSAARRLYCLIDAARDCDDLCVWVDGKFSIAPFPASLIQSELGKNYIGLYQRAGMPSKTDLVILDCKNPIHQEFLETAATVIESESFKVLNYWTDGAILDGTCRQFENLGIKNLSGVFGKEKNPIDFTALAPFFNAD